MIKKQIQFHIIIALILIFAYIILANALGALSSINLFSQGYLMQEQKTIGSTIENTHVSDSIELSVLKRRWYGKIHESITGSGKQSNVYLLGFISLPLSNNNKNYAAYHVLFFTAILIYLSLTITIKLINYRKYRYYYV